MFLSAFLLAIVLVLVIILVAVLILVLIIILIVILVTVLISILISILIVVLLVIHHKTSIHFHAVIRYGSIPTLLAFILCFKYKTNYQSCDDCSCNTSGSCP